MECALMPTHTRAERAQKRCKKHFMKECVRTGGLELTKRGLSRNNYLDEMQSSYSLFNSAINSAAG